jgi:hypothetical protein
MKVSWVLFAHTLHAFASFPTTEFFSPLADEYNFLNQDRISNLSKRKLTPTKLFPAIGSKKSFVAAHQVEAFYEGDSEDGNLVTAEMLMDSNRPTINLDNYKDVIKISCAGDLITVMFSNVEVRNKAFEAWSNEKEMAVVVYSCKKFDFTTTHIIEKVHLSGSDSLLIDTKEINPTEVFEDMVLTLNQTPKHSSGRMKEGYWTKSFSFNFDRTTSRAVRSEISLIDFSSFGSVICKNCYSYGQINTQIKIFIKKYKITGYELSINGGMFANIDLDIKKLANKEKTFLRLPVYWEIYGESYVPGVFLFTPMFVLDVGFSIGTEKDLKAKMGFDIDYPLSMNFKSEDILGKPSFLSSGQPLLKKHAYQVSKDLNVQTGIHLIPSMRYNLFIFLYELLGFNIKLDNKLGSEIRYGEFQNMICPSNAYQYHLRHEHSVLFDVNFGRKFTFKLATTGDIPLHCPSCIGCRIPKNGAEAVLEPDTDAVITQSIVKTTEPFITTMTTYKTSDTNVIVTPTELATLTSPTPKITETLTDSINDI